MRLVVLLIQLVHHQTVGIFQIVMTAGGDGVHAKDQHGPKDDDWGPLAVGLDWGEYRVPGQSIAASGAAVAVAAAKIVTLVVVSSGHNRTLPVPDNAHVTSWRVHPSCTAVNGLGSCAVWHECASTVKPRLLSLLAHD